MCVCLSTCAADLQVDGEDGVWAGGVFVHQRVAHCPVPPALLYDPLALADAVHSVHGEVPHIHPSLRMLFQLNIHQPNKETQHHPNLSACSNTLTFRESRKYSALKSPRQLDVHNHWENSLRNRFGEEQWSCRLLMFHSEASICLFETATTHLQSLLGVAAQKVSDFFVVNLQVGGPHQEFCIFCTLACTHTHKKKKPTHPTCKNSSLEIQQSLNKLRQRPKTTRLKWSKF